MTDFSFSPVSSWASASRRRRGSHGHPVAPL